MVTLAQLWDVFGGLSVIAALVLLWRISSRIGIALNKLEEHEQDIGRLYQRTEEHGTDIGELKGQLKVIRKSTS